MNFWQTTLEALTLLVNFNAPLWEIVMVSFRVSLSAISIVLFPSLLCAFLLAYIKFWGKWLLLSLINSLQAIPTVVIGLLLYLLLSRSGPLAPWQMLFSQKAMMLGQMLISFPIIVSMMHAALQSSDRRIVETALTLGVSLPRVVMTILWEMRFPVIAAIITAFSRIITEVGCSMMVGGNILGMTRNIPTAIAMESSKGEFAQGVALGIVLLSLALLLNFCLAAMRGKGQLRT